MSCNLRKAGYSLPALISFLSMLQGNLSFHFRPLNQLALRPSRCLFFVNISEWVETRKFQISAHEAGFKFPLATIGFPRRTSPVPPGTLV